jgi:hypothetical protein
MSSDRYKTKTCHRSEKTYYRIHNFFGAGSTLQKRSLLYKTKKKTICKRKRKKKKIRYKNNN